MVDTREAYTPANAKYVLTRGKEQLGAARRFWRAERIIPGDLANQATINPGKAYLQGAEQCYHVLDNTSFRTFLDSQDIEGFGRAIKSFRESVAPIPAPIVESKPKEATVKK